MAFTRGGDVKETLGIGRDAILKEIGGIILNSHGQIESWKAYDNKGVDITAAEEESSSKYNFRKKNIIIGIFDGKYSILKNRIRYDGPREGDEKDLITILLTLRDLFRQNGVPLFDFPFAQKISAKTIGYDLVAVKPMSAPTGQIFHIDYSYKTANKITKMGQQILNKMIKKTKINTSIIN